MELILSYFLPLFYAAADRLVGMGAPPKDHRTYGMTLAIIGGLWSVMIGWSHPHPFVQVLFGVVWCGYRSLPYSLFGGSLDAQTPKEIAGMFIRFMTPFPFWAGIAWTCELDMAYTLSAFSIAALLNTATSAWYGYVAKHAEATGTKLTPEPNQFLEPIHGFLYGGAMMTALFLK